MPEVESISLTQMASAMEMVYVSGEMEIGM
jgi:hypothetical protein